MSNSRPISNPWLADPAIFAAYRWLTWCVTALWLIAQGQVAVQGGMLAGALVLTMILTALARPYIRIAQGLPAILSLDILLATAIMIYSGGWESPFAFFAFGSLVLPALLFSWPGGIMAGLTYVALSQAGLAAAGTPAANRLFEGMLTSMSVPIAMVAPPIFAGFFALLIERIRQQAHPPGQRDNLRTRLDFTEPFQRDPRADASRPPRPLRDNRRPDTDPEMPLAVQITRTRTLEPNAEDLRHVLFAPLPALDMELGAICDVLTMRFRQQTGVPTRIAVIGRTRFVQSLYRDLLVRLAQEALLNIQQHASASTVSLTLRYDINSVALLIQDDGVGLVDGTFHRPGLHALRAMQYRIAEFGGGLEVFETEGGGVTVRAAMPLE